MPTTVVHAGWLAGCVAALAEGRRGRRGVRLLVPQRPPGHAVGAGRHPPTRVPPAGLGANLAVRRQAFEKVGGFTEAILPGEDIDLCWRLQLEGFRFEVATDAVVAKRERSKFKQVFRQAFAYGRCGPVLHRRYRGVGAHRDLYGAYKSWVWLVMSPPLTQPERRIEWARIAGTAPRPAGRLDQGAGVLPLKVQRMNVS